MRQPTSIKKIRRAGYEAVYYLSDPASRLRGFIAIHNTNLGPATGGTRFMNYKNPSEALRDVLNLSAAMTYKCAMAGVPFGGGKAVIIEPKGKHTRKKLLETFAECVNKLEGRFTTGEDLGVNESDIVTMSRISPYINCTPETSSDPSPWAALSVYYSIKTLLGKVKGKTFAVQGVGKVGGELCRLLYKDGAILTVADPNKKRLVEIKKKFPRIKAVPPNQIYKQKVDVYVPCALGGTLNKKTIPELRCKIICGAANNQLSSPKDGGLIYKMGIIYVPDYVANAGGLINVVDPLQYGKYNKNRVREKIKTIAKTVKKIINQSKNLKKPTNVIADQMAEKIIKKI